MTNKGAMSVSEEEEEAWQQGSGSVCAGPAGPRGAHRPVRRCPGRKRGGGGGDDEDLASLRQPQRSVTPVTVATAAAVPVTNGGDL